MKMKLSFLPLSLFLFLFVGCAKNTPSVSEYRISVKENVKEFPQSGCRDKSLKIAQAFSSSALTTQKMNYAQGDYKQFVFSQAQWAISPNRAVTSEILKHVKSTKLFKNVQISKSRIRNGFLLETNIEEFMQYFSKDEQESYAKVSVNLALIDTKTNKVTATTTFSRRVEAETIDAYGGVVALNKALNYVVLDSADWFGEVCR